MKIATQLDRNLIRGLVYSQIQSADEIDDQVSEQSICECDPREDQRLETTRRIRQRKAKSHRS